MREKKAMQKLESYVLKTYGEHYAKNGLQAIDLIIANGYGIEHAMACVIKYASRLGKKEGADMEHDILKICHYGLLALVALEKMTAGKNERKQITIPRSPKPHGGYERRHVYH